MLAQAAVMCLLISQDHSNGTLLLPQLDRLHLAFKRRQVSPSASSSQDQQAQQPTKSVIPTQKRVTRDDVVYWYLIQ